jgi:hypothetical protein
MGPRLRGGGILCLVTGPWGMGLGGPLWVWFWWWWLSFVVVVVVGESKDAFRVRRSQWMSG